jgi:hypothetical protein
MLAKLTAFSEEESDWQLKLLELEAGGRSLSSHA